VKKYKAAYKALVDKINALHSYAIVQIGENDSKNSIAFWVGHKDAAEILRVWIDEHNPKGGRVKTPEIIDRLEQYQSWRKGGYDPMPSEITELLDAAILALRKILADEK